MSTGPSDEQILIRKLSDEVAHLKQLAAQSDEQLEESQAKINQLNQNTKYSSERFEYSARLHSLLFRVAVLLMVGVTLLAAFVLLDRKLPDRNRRSYAQEMVAETSAANERTSAKDLPSTPVGAREAYRPRSSNLENARALVYSAIEAYTRRSENAGRATIPGEELAEKVIEPLTKAGLITAETGKALLISAMDGGKTLITDYFHQKWQDQFRNKHGKDSAAGTPTVVCSPVFNAAAPAAVARNSPPQPMVKNSSPPRSNAAPFCPAPDRAMSDALKR